MSDIPRNWVIEKIKTELADEKKNFAIAYAALDPQYHGYLMSIEKPVSLWGTNAPKDFYDELKRSYSVVQWVKGSEESGLRLKKKMPYLGVSGYLAMAADDHDVSKGERFDITDEILEIGKRTFLRAVAISTKYGKRTGMVEIKEKSDLEKDWSNAVRKALSGFGYGRFPIYRTEYGEDPGIHEFIEFKKKKVEVKTEAK